MVPVCSSSCRGCFATQRQACIGPVLQGWIKVTLCSNEEHPRQASTQAMGQLPVCGNLLAHLPRLLWANHGRSTAQEEGNAHRRSARRHSMSRPDSRISGSMPRRFSTSAAIVLVSAASSSSLSWPSALRTSPFSDATGTARSSTSNCGPFGFSRPWSALRCPLQQHTPTKYPKIFLKTPFVSSKLRERLTLDPRSTAS